jgi:hypothetical protein
LRGSVNYLRGVGVRAFHRSLAIVEL